MPYALCLFPYALCLMPFAFCLMPYITIVKLTKYRNEYVFKEIINIFSMQNQGKTATAIAIVIAIKLTKE